MTALVVCAVRCCWLLSAACCSCWPKSKISRISDVTATGLLALLYTRLKLFRKVQVVIPIRTPYMYSASSESLWTFSRQKNAVQPTPVKNFKLQHNLPAVLSTWKLYIMRLFQHTGYRLRSAASWYLIFAKSFLEKLSSSNLHRFGLTRHHDAPLLQNLTPKLQQPKKNKKQNMPNPTPLISIPAHGVPASKQAKK